MKKCVCLTVFMGVMMLSVGCGGNVAGETTVAHVESEQSSATENNSVSDSESDRVAETLTNAGYV